MYKYILGFILINIFVAAFPNTDIKNNINQSQEDDYVQEHDSPFLHNELKTTLTSERPISNYEVTEIVVDIPDNRTKQKMLLTMEKLKELQFLQTTKKRERRTT
ncbi:uncharacterized protein LOC116777523 isoform X2 [Danaus plexippus]|uniref:uncharacterized protein LOC116777523 isoform X2 n=1 Tax=Danaus plexippus TaxID=13037 RepID=UPI002AB1EA6B|nr:uncharacterized protein LOC116777523 isoform X2 [Danaus plexippus]